MPMARWRTPSFRMSRDSVSMASPLLLFAEGGIDHRGVQHLAGAVHHRDLAAVAVAGIQPHSHLALHRRLHEQRLQVQRKVTGWPPRRHASVSPLRDLPLKQTERSAGRRRPLPQRARTVPTAERPLHGCALYRMRRAMLSVQLHRHLQEALLLAPVDGQYLVALRACEQAPVEIVVKAINGVLLLRRLTDQTGPFGRISSRSVLRMAASSEMRLGQDIGCALQGHPPRVSTPRSGSI